MEVNKKKKVLITGANGFIGLNVLKFLNENSDFDIFALVHNNYSDDIKSMTDVKVIKSDVTDESIVSNLNKTAKFDYIVHIAGLAKDIGPDEKFKKLNFDSVKYLGTVAGEKFIYISSTDVYGIKDFNNADETTPYNNFPKNPYPKYKIEAEKWVKSNCKKYVIIRPAAVYGKNDKTLEKRVIDFLKSSPFLVYFGKWKGKNRWPLADVLNISKVVLFSLKYNELDNQAVNIIDSQSTTIEQYYQNIIKTNFPDKKFKTIYLPMFVGKIIGFLSTFISNLLNLSEPIMDPTYYAVHHISSNLDFSSKKMEQILSLYNEREKDKVNFY